MIPKFFLWKHKIPNGFFVETQKCTRTFCGNTKVHQSIFFNSRGNAALFLPKRLGFRVIFLKSHVHKININHIYRMNFIDFPLYF